MQDFFHQQYCIPGIFERILPDDNRQNESHDLILFTEKVSQWRNQGSLNGSHFAGDQAMVKCILRNFPSISALLGLVMQ